MNLFLLIIFISIIEYVGDSNFKFYARTKNINNLYIGIISYVFMVKGFIYALQHGNLLYVNSMWDATSIIVDSVLAYILLHEHLDNNIQYIGLLLIISGIFALNYGKIPF
jgi:multidrug transporter EmrE-like cation transporter